MTKPRAAHGVTLIELVITIAIVGLLAGLVIYFGAPIKGYSDTSRRAALADAADTALRRIGRDLRLALPNSVRISGSTHLEFLLVRAGGRYRGEEGAAAANSCGSTAADVLSFASADTCFKTLGDIANVADIDDNSDFLVVYNLAPGTPGADAYESGGVTGGNKSLITGVTAGTGSERINFESNTFLYESPGRRFFVVEGPVSYVCDGGSLYRYSGSGYGISAAQPVPPPIGNRRLLVSGVSSCSFSYDANTNAQGAGLVTLQLTLTVQTTGGGSESVTLYHAVHVNNVP
jgi:MSHA biogenesis protein MshO